MRKDTIIHFVCFITNLELDEFTPKWEQFAAELMKKPAEPILQQLASKVKKRYKYISQHEGTEGDFLFNSMTEKRSGHFPEHNVRVIHAGGYLPLQAKKRFNKVNDDLRLIAFISHNERDIDFYRQLSPLHHLNIYEAYYENCAFSYILEFSVSEANAEELEQLLKTRPGIETGIYKASMALHI